MPVGPLGHYVGDQHTVVLGGEDMFGPGRAGDVDAMHPWISGEDDVGEEADLPRLGMKTRMILTVHDELLFESPRDEADAAAAVVRERMENAVSLRVPLTVDVGTAENWRDAKP